MMQETKEWYVIEIAAVDLGVAKYLKRSRP